MPADIVYGSLDEMPNESYDGYVETVRNRMTAAFEETKIALRKAAEGNKRYYDVRVRPSEYRVGSWVYCYNPRKFKGRQDKWQRKYSGPFLVIATPSAVTVRLQRTKGAKPFVVHVDKVKPYLADTPKSWISEAPATEVTEPQLGNTERNESEMEMNIRLRDSSPANDAEVAYTVDEAFFRTRPKREVHPPKHVSEYVRSAKKRIHESL